MLSRRAQKMNMSVFRSRSSNDRSAVALQSTESWIVLVSCHHRIIIRAHRPVDNLNHTSTKTTNSARRSRRNQLLRTTASVQPSSSAATRLRRRPALGSMNVRRTSESISNSVRRSQPRSSVAVAQNRWRPPSHVRTPVEHLAYSESATSAPWRPLLANPNLFP